MSFNIFSGAHQFGMCVWARHFFVFVSVVGVTEYVWYVCTQGYSCDRCWNVMDNKLLFFKKVQVWLFFI